MHNRSLLHYTLQYMTLQNEYSERSHTIVNEHSACILKTGSTTSLNNFLEMYSFIRSTFREGRSISDFGISDFSSICNLDCTAAISLLGSLSALLGVRTRSHSHHWRVRDRTRGPASRRLPRRWRRRPLRSPRPIPKRLQMQIRRSLSLRRPRARPAHEVLSDDRRTSADSRHSRVAPHWCRSSCAISHSGVVRCADASYSIYVLLQN